MNAADYTIAAIPEPWQILGLRLKPFCLGHYLLMERFDVAFVSEESREPQFSDLILGLTICSMAYEEFLAFLEKPDWRDDIKAWAAKIGGKFDFWEKVKLFSRYIADASVQPVVIFERQGNTGGGHWSQYVLGTLTGPCGYSLTEARNLPLAQAFSDFYRHAESMGVLTIADPEVAAALKLAEADPGSAFNMDDIEFGHVDPPEAPIWP